MLGDEPCAVLCCGSFILKRGWALQGGKSPRRNHAHLEGFFSDDPFSSLLFSDFV